MPIFFARPICHGRDRLHLAPPQLHLRPPRPWGLSIGNFNIQDGQGFGIAHVIRVVHIDGFDLIILKEIKVTKQAYCRNRLG